jgi:hypothetical protein
VSVDLDLRFDADLTLNWVIAMKQNRTIMTLAALFLIGGFVTASAVPAMEGTERGSGFYGHVSAPSPRSYENFLQDDATPGAPGFTGFGGYLEDQSPRLVPATPSIHGSPTHRCGPGDGCYGFGGDGQYTRLWGSVDYMMLWSKSRYLPPLVTTDPTGRGAQENFPGMVLFGDENIGKGIRSAGRFSAGLWLDRHEQVGVGGRFLISQTDEVSFNRASNAGGLPVLARPFYDEFSGGLNAVLASNPPPPPGALIVGQVADQARNDLMNLDAYLRVLLYQYDERRLDLLIGYQYSEIRDSLTLSTTNNLPAAFRDQFSVNNSFHGAGLGLQGEYRYGHLTFSMLSKLGFGNMHREVRIAGQGTAPSLGGILAQPSNIGTYSDDVFSFVPEVEVKMLYEVAKNLELSLGYSFLYWTDVALAGDQIDTVDFGGHIWPRSDRRWIQGLPGATAPAFNGINDGGFWAQGLTFGVTFKR